MGACECVRHGESHAKQDPARRGTLRETGGGRHVRSRERVKGLCKCAQNG